MPDTESDPLEKAIADELWRWAFASDQIRAEITSCTLVDPSNDTSECPLAVMLEYYICGVFHLIDYTRTRGIWCDGIAELSIVKTTRLSFLIDVAAYCPNALAPIEIEFHFPARRSCHSARVLLRYNDPGKGSNSHDAYIVLSRRPKRDRDWTVAVELTD